MKKHLTIALLVIGSLYNMYGQKKYKIDFTDPESVVNAIFYSAQTKDYSILQCICDPLGKGDGDTKRLCSISKLAEQVKSYGGSEKTRQILDEFVSTFELGRVNGQVTFIEFEGEKIAKVPFLFNHPGGEKRSNETMNLVQRFGNWYISSF